MASQLRSAAVTGNCKLGKISFKIYLDKTKLNEIFILFTKILHFDDLFYLVATLNR